MRILAFIYALFENNSIALKNIPGIKQKVYFAYLYTLLKFKKLLLNDLLKKRNGSFTVWGKKMYFPDYTIFEMMFIDIFLKLIYEFESDNPKPKIIICGANIGIEVVYLKHKFPNATITFFEPARVSFEYLEKNIKQFTGCTAIKTALVGSSKKHVHLETPATNVKSDISASISDKIGSIRWKNLKVRREKVKAIKLSSYIKKKEKIDFVQIDIEGVEYEVLRDLENSGRLTNIKEMFVEYHHKDNTTYKKIVSLLTRNKYKLIASGDATFPLAKFKDDFYIAYFWAYKG